MTGPKYEALFKAFSAASDGLKGIPGLNGSLHRYQDFLEKDKSLERERLTGLGLLFQDAGMGWSRKDWPTGRGFYLAASKRFCVWLGEEDHLRITALQPDGDLGAVVARLANATAHLSNKLSFAWDERLGYLTSCPTNLGSTVRASAILDCPKTHATAAFKKVCADMKLQIRPAVGGEQGDEDEEGRVEVSNIARLGLSEFQAVKTMVDGAKKLIELEKAA